MNEKEKSIPNNIEIRLIIKPDDEIFPLFMEAKKNLGIKSNAELTRFLIKLGYETFMEKQKR